MDAPDTFYAKMDDIAPNTCSLAKARWDARDLMELDRIALLPANQRAESIEVFLDQRLEQPE